METAFSLIHSGAAPAAGRSLISTPKALAMAAAATRMRLISTQEPICSTGGIPNALQTPFRPSPARSAASGVSKPALAQAWALQPVVTTSTLFFINSFTMFKWPKSCCTLGLLQPTTAPMPRTVSALDGSQQGIERAAQSVHYGLNGEAHHALCLDVGDMDLGGISILVVQDRCLYYRFGGLDCRFLVELHVQWHRGTWPWGRWI